MTEADANTSGGALERLLKRRAISLRVRPSITGEWAWIVGRTALVAVAGIGVMAFLRGTPPFTFLMAAIGFVLAYNAVLAWLVLKKRLYGAFFIGLTLDTVMVLLAWAVATEGLSEEPEPTDIYLIMFPIVVVAVIRLGWPLGVVQGTVFIVWMAATALWFLPSNFYDVEQMPLRVLFLTTTMGLTLWLMARLNRARDEAEDLAHERATLAEISRVIGSTLNLGEVYGLFAALVKDFVPYQRISVSRLDPETGRLEHVYRHDDPAVIQADHTGLTMDSELSTVVRLRRGSLYGGETTGTHTSMAVPLVSGDRVVGAISAHAPASVNYTALDLERLENIAYQISPAIESSRLAEDLISSENRLRSVLDSSQDAVITINPDGQITGVNAGAVSMFSLPASRIEGCSLELLVPSWEAIAAGPGQANETGGRAVETAACRADGSSFQVEAVTARLSGHEGSVITLRDITERKTEEDARMRVLQTVAHELRTPLSAVIGARDLLTSAAAAPDDLDGFTFERLMGVMDRGVNRLDTLGHELTDLVDLIDMQRGSIQLDRELVRVSNIVDTALEAVKPTLVRQGQVVQATA